ncbi:MAG: hypothetical protein ACRDIL_00275 [Candidatus Limnocylindrales bacterium]
MNVRNPTIACPPTATHAGERPTGLSSCFHEKKASKPLVGRPAQRRAQELEDRWAVGRLGRAHIDPAVSEGPHLGADDSGLTP